MINYYQFVPAAEVEADANKVDEVVKHIVEHLRSVVSADDDPKNVPQNLNLGISVEDSVRESDGAVGFLIRGYIDADPVAPYLQPDFNPEDDVRNNPLSVKSILEEDKNERSKSD